MTTIGLDWSAPVSQRSTHAHTLFRCVRKKRPPRSNRLHANFIDMLAGSLHSDRTHDTKMKRMRRSEGRREDEESEEDEERGRGGEDEEVLDGFGRPLERLQPFSGFRGTPGTSRAFRGLVRVRIRGRSVATYPIGAITRKPRRSSSFPPLPPPSARHSTTSSSS